MQWKSQREFSVFALQSEWKYGIMTRKRIAPRKGAQKIQEVFHEFV